MIIRQGATGDTGIYLDNAATSFPKPESVYKRLDEAARHFGGNPGRSGHKLSVMAEDLLETSREAVASFLGIRNYKRLAFTLNATDALNIAIRGVVKPGDKVITSVMEHNSVLRPLNELEGAGIVSVIRLLPVNGRINFNAILPHLDKQVRLVALTHASNVMGTVNPAESIARGIKEHSDALFLLDASQTAGTLPIDADQMGVDLLAFPGHKALYGPMGTGGLFVREGLDIKPLRTGGSGEDSENPLQPARYPYHLEAGTPNLPGIAALAEGVRYIWKEGREKIFSYEKELHKHLIEGMHKIKGLQVFSGGEETVATVSVAFERFSVGDAAAILDAEYGIAARSGLHCAPEMHRYLGSLPAGLLRLSIGAFNTEADIETALRALSEIACL